MTLVASVGLKRWIAMRSTDSLIVSPRTVEMFQEGDRALGRAVGRARAPGDRS